MGYTTSTLTRKRGSLRIHNYYGDGQTHLGESDCDTTVTYSWRTGRRASVGISGSAPYTPSKGNLTQSLADRRRLINEVVETVSQRDKPSTQFYMGRDIGHEFSTQRYQCFGNVRETYRGQMGGAPFVMTLTGQNTGALLGSLVSPLPRSLPGYSIVSDMSRAAYFSKLRGATALPSSLFEQRDLNSLFKSMAPSSPVLPIAETALELLRGDFPSVLKNLKNIRGRISDLKSLGKEHLNMQFGWAPIFKDMMMVIETLMSLDSLIYSSNDRRHRRLPERFESSSSLMSFARTGVNLPQMNATGLYSAGINTAPKGAISKELMLSVRQDARISARFTNARPNSASNGFWDKAVELHYQLGLQDPTLIWDLTKWSWLFDWFINIGHSISNVNNFSKQSGVTPLDYAYMTRKTAVVAYMDGLSYSWTSGSVSVEGSISPRTEISTTLTRERISPFGPGVSLDSLSTYQWSILVALGLARS